MRLSELQQQIRYALSQLGARNAHHEFEHLCRRVARARVCSNILPATGPVSAGGDQARDFETFRSFLQENIAGGSTFVGLVSAVPLAFACTIQKDGLNDKIRRDVGKIASNGSRVAGIHYFLAEDLPVAKRHDIQSWATKKYSVQVEIYDGLAISEMLTDPDLFDAAIEYLRLPSDSYPVGDTHEEWYMSLKEASVTASDDAPDLTYSNFYDLKRAIRAATYDNHLKPDLPLWLRLLAHFENTDAPPDLQRRACYEISVARLRGQGTMDGRGRRLAWYFAEIPSYPLRQSLRTRPTL